MKALLNQIRSDGLTFWPALIPYAQIVTSIQKGALMRMWRLLAYVSVSAVAATALLALSPSEARAGEKIGDCEILFDYPHGSVHSNGNVSADMRIKCATPQRYLGVESFLYRPSENPPNQWQIVGPPASDENVNYISSVAAEPCSKATYTSEANFLIVDNNGVRHERFGVKSPPIANPCKLP